MIDKYDAYINNNPAIPAVAELVADCRRKDERIRELEDIVNAAGQLLTYIP